MKILSYFMFGLFFFALQSGDLAAVTQPDNLDQIVENVLEAPLLELVEGDTGVVDNNGVSIWYELIHTKHPQKKGTVLLIMGSNATAMIWPEYFYRPFLNAGYSVIRSDHRGLGLSSWMPEWSEENSYTASDMASDNIAIINHLSLKKVHVVGFSVGAMIAHELAIAHPNRVLSLTSISGAGYLHDPDLPAMPVDPDFIPQLTQVIDHYSKGAQASKIANQVKMQVSIINVLRGSDHYATENKTYAEISRYELTKRQGYNPDASVQHDYVNASLKNRYEDLAQLKIPTLIVHSVNDPLVSWKHAKKLANVMQGAETLWLKEMGHDLPLQASKKISKSILKLINTKKNSGGKNET